MRRELLQNAIPALVVAMLRIACGSDTSARSTLPPRRLGVFLDSEAQYIPRYLPREPAAPQVCMCGCLTLVGTLFTELILMNILANSQYLHTSAKDR